MQDKPDDLIVPEQVLLRFQKRGDSLLGFMIPYDPDDPSMSDKDQTVLKWSAGYNPSILEKQALVMNNEPVTGVRIQHMVSRWSTENKVWRVEDPRGFELEIMTENLDYLLNHCNIVDRKFDIELIWMSRIRGQTNWLVPTSIEDLEDIRDRTNLRRKARSADTLSLRDLNRGDKVRLYDGRVVRYFGSMWAEIVGYSTRLERAQWFEILEDTSFVQGYNKMSEGISFMTTLRVIEKIEDDPVTDEQAEDYVNRLLESPNSKASGVSFVRCKKFTADELEPTMVDNKPAYRIGDKTYIRHVTSHKDARRRRFQ